MSESKWLQLENMLRDGMDPIYIMRWALPRITMRDLQILHQCYLRDKEPENKRELKVTWTTKI